MTAILIDRETFGWVLPVVIIAICLVCLAVTFIVTRQRE